MPNFKLNLKHLRYFWAVASHGSIVQASQALCLTPQTISGQLRVLEEQVGSKLFRREGRALVLTDVGRTVYAYTDEMFRLGNELQEVLEGRAPVDALTVQVGVATGVPGLLAYRVLEPVLKMPGTVRLVCRDAPLVDLLGELSLHKLDLVLADTPVTPGLNVRAYNHLLGESGVSFFAGPALARELSELKKTFPACLEGMPMLMPGPGNLQRDLEVWFSSQGITPRLLAQFDHPSLMKAFGEGGYGVFAAPSVMEPDLLARHGVRVVGRAADLTERYFAISAERRIKHPAVSEIAARASTLFS